MSVHLNDLITRDNNATRDYCKARPAAYNAGLIGAPKKLGARTIAGARPVERRVMRTTCIAANSDSKTSDHSTPVFDGESNGRIANARYDSKEFFSDLVG